MSLLETLFSQGTIERLGWMLVHFLWQAAAVALLLAVLLRWLRRTGANLRYAIACGALILMVVLPLVTMQIVEVPGPAAEAGPPPEVSPPATVEPLPIAVEAVRELPSLSSTPPMETADLATPIPWQERVAATLEPALPYLVLGWLAGVFGLSAWHLGGWTQLHRLKRRMTHKTSVALHATLDELATRLGVRRAVTLLESAVVDVPAVVGWLRPVILLPASALTGLSPDQLRAILAHELAHIRRYDYLANILQTVVEILGFYHPAVWWVSNRIRIERENCCDDLAVHVCGSSLQYARALTFLEETRHSRNDLALAASGGSLMARIARLLGRPAVDDRRLVWLPGLIALLLVAGLVVPAALVLAEPGREATAAVVPQPGSPPTDEPARAQVLQRFAIIDVFADRVLDMATAIEARDLLTLMRPADASQSIVATTPPTLEELMVPLRDVFDRFEPIPLKSKDLVNLLLAHGHAVRLSTPMILTRDDEPASVRLGSENDPNAPDSPSTDGYMKLTAMAHVLEDQDAVRLHLDYEDRRAIGSEDDPNQPLSTTQVASTLVVPNGQAVAVVARNTRVPRAPVRLLLVGPISVNRPERAMEQVPDMEGVRTIVESSSQSNAQQAQVLIDFVIAKALTAAVLERETLLQIGHVLAAERPQFAARIVSDPKLRLTLGEMLKEYVTRQPLSQETGQALLDLLRARGFVSIRTSPKVTTSDGDPAYVRSVSTWFARPSQGTDPAAGASPEKVEYGTVIKATPHVDINGDITLEMAVTLTEPSPEAQPGGLPVVRTMAAATTVSMPDNRCFSLLVEPSDYKSRRAQDAESLLIMFRPSIVGPTAPPLDPPVPQTRQDGRRPRQVLLDARVVSMDRANMLNLGVEWLFPALQYGDADLTPLTLGYSPDRAFTSDLMTRLNQLASTNQAEILANPQIVALEGRPAQLRSVQEEWFLISNALAVSLPAELQKIQAGTTLTMTPRVGDHNEITLEMAIELSNSLPRGAGSDLPIVTRRQSKNSVTIRDGGTIAVAGLTENPQGPSGQSARSVAILVTATLLPTTGQTAPPSSEPAGTAPPSSSVGGVSASFTKTDPPTYLVYRPITAKFEGVDLLQAIHDIAKMAEVPIMPAPEVHGRVSAEFDKVDLETALRITLAGTPYLFKKMEDYYIVAERADVRKSISRLTDQETHSSQEQTASLAWTLMQYPNCPPLLLGLTQQFAKVLEPSRQDDLVWKEVRDGGTLRLRIDVEGEDAGEVLIGLFEDATWLQEPVAVRRVAGAGEHVLSGLPAGRYQIGAMVGKPPVARMLGVQRQWPQAVEIASGRTVSAEVLVSQEFQQWASDGRSEGISRDYLGDWSELDRSRLLQGRLLGPDGKPIRFGLVQIREYKDPARRQGGIAAPDVGTSEQGYYRFDGMNWPYTVSAMWRDPMPAVFGYRSQFMRLSRVMEGPQQVDFRFKSFPTGTAKIAGRVTDDNGQPVKGFFLRVTTPPVPTRWSETMDGQYETYVTYTAPFLAEDGRFEMVGLPSGLARVYPIPFDGRKYEIQWGRETTLAADGTAAMDFELVRPKVRTLYGRVLFEDGTPAVPQPAPWPDATTRIVVCRHTFPVRGGASADLDADGYFTLELRDSQYEPLASGEHQLSIGLPNPDRHGWRPSGEFPFDKLAEDRSQAGVVTVKRLVPAPVFQGPLGPGMPLPPGWRLNRKNASARSVGKDAYFNASVTTSDPQKGPRPGDLEFVIYDPNDKEIEAFKSQSMMIMPKAQQYRLIARRVKDGRVAHGPFLLDMTRPDFYELIVDLGTGVKAD